MQINANLRMKDSLDSHAFADLHRERGFTIIELIISVAFIAMAAGAMTLLLRNQYSGNLTSDASIIASRLGEAQARALSGVEGIGWGIHFDNVATATPFYALFPGAWVNSSSASSTYYLTGGVQFTTPAGGTSTNIIFTKLSGAIATNTSIVVSLRSSTSSIKTISVTTQGAITVTQ